MSFTLGSPFFVWVYMLRCNLAETAYKVQCLMLDKWSALVGSRDSWLQIYCFHCKFTYCIE